MPPAAEAAKKTIPDASKAGSALQKNLPLILVINIFVLVVIVVILFFVLHK